MSVRRCAHEQYRRKQIIPSVGGAYFGRIAGHAVAIPDLGFVRFIVPYRRSDQHRGVVDIAFPR